jgi:hypothetical protein
LDFNSLTPLTISHCGKARLMEVLTSKTGKSGGISSPEETSTRTGKTLNITDAQMASSSDITLHAPLVPEDDLNPI